MTRGRPTARAIYLFSGVLLAMAAIFSACAETRFGLGDECLKNEDCLSNICSGGKCAAAPPIGTVTAPDAAPDTSMGDGGDGGDATPGETGGSDSPGPQDASDGPPAVDANKPDAHEAGIDAAGDSSGADASDAAQTDADDSGAVDAADAGG